MKRDLMLAGMMIVLPLLGYIAGQESCHNDRLANFMPACLGMIVPVIAFVYLLYTGAAEADIEVEWKRKLMTQISESMSRATKR